MNVRGDELALCIFHVRLCFVLFSFCFVAKLFFFIDLKDFLFRDGVVPTTTPLLSFHHSLSLLLSRLPFERT